MKLIYTFAFSLFSFASFGQIGIGTSSPDPSAQLDISSSNKGLLIPRVTQANRPGGPGMVAATPGLMIYQTDDIPGFYVYDGDKWDRLIKSSEAPAIPYVRAFKHIAESLMLPANDNTINSLTFVTFNGVERSEGVIDPTDGKTFIIKEAGTYQIRYSLSPDYMAVPGIRAVVALNDVIEIEQTKSINTHANHPTLQGECMLTVGTNTMIRVGISSSDSQLKLINFSNTTQAASMTILRLK